ncbi:hypothetical protein P154DRAFT_519950 [Amniculicola lignicola CBS 123094]|uniref:Uncharacterized protein n=1 Tax=Amniculicola lignicola CBS 123094 TaxID=1392246 RepID=A0A6A5WPV3_9PLEO|nr:hypothetical protein P154DRAFT_519950 [Amniculicola lignicola CBS 123094]
MSSPLHTLHVHTVQYIPTGPQQGQPCHALALRPATKPLSLAPAGAYFLNRQQGREVLKTDYFWAWRTDVLWALLGRRTEGDAVVGLGGGLGGGCAGGGGGGG